MVISVDLSTASPTVTLRDPDDFGRFHIEVGGAVSLEALRSLAAAAGAGGEQGEAGLARMLEYAGTKGWLIDDGASIKAHVEQVDR